jgi:cytochrome c6
MSFTMKSAKRVIALTALAIIAVVASMSSGSHWSVLGAADGAATFKTKCAGCHGADGSGNTPAGKGLKVKDLGSAEVQGLSDAQLYAIIANGKGKMPPYEKSLGADTCKALVAHIRTFKK